MTVWAGGVQRGGGAGDVEIMTSGPVVGAALRRWPGLGADSVQSGWKAIRGLWVFVCCELTTHPSIWFL